MNLNHRYEFGRGSNDLGPTADKTFAPKPHSNLKPDPAPHSISVNASDLSPDNSPDFVPPNLSSPLSLPQVFSYIITLLVSRAAQILLLTFGLDSKNKLLSQETKTKTNPASF